MSEKVQLADNRTVKVAMNAITLYLQSTGNELLEDPAFTKLLVAGKGGFNGEDSFITIDGQKVARTCAMTGAIFAHDNTDKTASFFYKNGSYMIGAEIVKANARKEWEFDREDREAELEDQMLEGEISPKDWKVALTAIQAEAFEYIIPEDTKAELIANYNGYETKEDFIEAYEADEVAPFTDYEEETEALRSLAPKRETEE